MRFSLANFTNLAFREDPARVREILEMQIEKGGYMEKVQQQKVQKRYQQELTRYQKQIEKTKKVLGVQKAA